MDKLTSAKILVGSTDKAVQAAKVYGKMCIPELLFLDIVNELNNLCELANNYEDTKMLTNLARTIQHKNSSICNYKNSNYIDQKFITGKK